MATTPSDQSYGPESIRIVKGLDGVRLRPGMYVGDTRDGTGLHHLLWEVIANVIDQHLGRWVTRLSVGVRDGVAMVEDDGPGLPIETPPGEPCSTLDVLFTTLGIHPSWGIPHPHVHIAPHYLGGGLGCVSALCAEVEVETHRLGVRWKARYERGTVREPLRDLGPSDQHGTRLRLRPDPEIFGETSFDLALMESRLRELAWLNPLLTIRFQDRILPGRGGPIAWVHSLVYGTKSLCSDDVFALQHTDQNGSVDAAVGWHAEHGEPLVHAFVNQNRAPEGTHVQGLYSGLARGIRDAALSPKVKAAPIMTIREALRSGLVAVVHVTLTRPLFKGPTRECIASPEGRSLVNRAVREAMGPWLQRNPAITARLLKRIATQG